MSIDKARVKPGYWRHEDGTKTEGGARIWWGRKHFYIPAEHIRTVADALHDLADQNETGANNP